MGGDEADLGSGGFAEADEATSRPGEPQPAIVDLADAGRRLDLAPSRPRGVPGRVRLRWPRAERWPARPIAEPAREDGLSSASR